MAMWDILITDGYNTAEMNLPPLCSDVLWLIQDAVVAIIPPTNYMIVTHTSGKAHLMPFDSFMNIKDRLFSTEKKAYIHQKI